MDYRQLERFVLQHGRVSLVDTQGRTRILPSGDQDVHKLIERADRFLWDGLSRSRAEMEDLIAQSERGLMPGCSECDRLEKELIASRGKDRGEGNLDQKYELPALTRFQDHRVSHQ